MQARALVLTVTIGALALGACSGGDDDASSSASGDTAADTATAGDTADGGDETAGGDGDTTGGAPAGDVDCSGITPADIQQYGLDVQLLAQIRDAGSISTLTSLGYDPDGLARILESFRVVEGHGVSGLGDPGEAIDFYVGANDRMRELVAAGEAVTPDQIADYNSYAGDATEFLGKQLGLNAALSEACPDLVEAAG